ncbi:hypothetical protein KHQ89_04055 [Mycoplasmatota bacterium]|nr:hypothetical protein KHQ89_04055 [Mycoplasmatota bacterium]
MKCKIEKHVNMSFTGSNVLAQIQDNSTPNIDLLVRESIQNSADAILDNKEFARINYKVGEFDTELFKNMFRKFEYIDENKLDNYGKYLSISDENTTGLLGDHKKSKNKPQNLYNLVYDIMNQTGKKSDAGGSWGIGKSVYYRFGRGFCIYYSRTLENNEFIDKLAIVFIEDENNENNIIINNNNRGIAFFGDIDYNSENEPPMPIYDRNEIREILSIFKQDLYENEVTGTVVIIPYLNEKKFLKKLNDEENYWWKNDFSKTIEIAIQRWYFPRLQNKKFKGKYIIVGIDDEPVKLNHFFGQLQKMYNGDDEKSYHRKIRSKNPKIDLGDLYIRKFESSELFMNKPYSYPDPLTMLDLFNERDDSLPIIGLTRSSGMITSYDSKFRNASLNDNEYLIGIFKLDKEEKYQNERLEEYIRATEKANHKDWQDANVEKFPQLSDKTPVRKIFGQINSVIMSKYKISEVEINDSSDSKLRKILGKLLMPPSGFGDGADVGRKKPGENKPKATKKKKSVILQLGFENGRLLFQTSTYLEESDKIDFVFKIKSGAKTYSFVEWINMGFELPCKLYDMSLSGLVIGKEKIKGSKKILFETKMGDKLLAKSLKIQFLKTLSGIPYGISMTNVNIEDEVIKIIFTVSVEPLDSTYSISIDSSIKKDLEGEYK